MNISKLLEDLRKAGVVISADCIENYARIFGERAGDRCGDPCTPSGGDFLYDIVHLNLSYLTQAARLGSAYSIFAYRILGALYGTYGASAPCAPAGDCTLSFEGAPHDKQTRVVTLCNSSGKTSTPKVPSQVLVRSGAEQLALVPTFLRGGAPADSMPLIAGETARIAVQVEIPTQAAGTYCGSFKIELDDRSVEYDVTVTVLAP